jgi:hypothetical protein
MVSWTGRQRLRFRWYRLRLTVREMNTAGRIVQLSANGRAPSTMHPAGSQMTGTPTGLATTADQKLPAAPRAAVITPGDRGYDKGASVMEPAMLTTTQIAGFVGAGLAGAAYIPQISHLIRARCSAGISRLAFAVWLLVSLLITARAVAIHAGVLPHPSPSPTGGQDRHGDGQPSKRA